MSEIIDAFVYRYPQLTLGLGPEIKNSELYKNIIQRGFVPEKLELPIVSSDEELIEVDTPIGKTNVLYLPIREVFEYFAKVLAHKNEDVKIEKTTGAMLISGLNNWRKIEAHEKEFLKTHNSEQWDDEFDRFTADKANYKDVVLLISKGYYSAVDYTFTPYDENTWLDISKKIRIYHEISHLISRKLYPDHKDAIRDEVIADCIGIIGATGKYDSELEKMVLGLQGDVYTAGGRLQNYVDETKLDEAVSYALSLIEKLKDYCINNMDEPFKMLLKIEELYIK